MAKKSIETSKNVAFVSEKTGRRYCVGGCIPSEKPSASRQFSTTAKYMDKELPPSVDLRQFMTPVENQEESYSCVGNALAAAYEFLIKKNSGKHIDVSRLFIYYNSRLKDGHKEYDMLDMGTQISSAIEALAEFGCCKEQSYPFSVSNVNRKPPEKCYAEAKHYRIQEGMQLRGELSEMKACLAEGYPFVFGLQLYQSFRASETNGGRVPIPNYDDASQDPVISHHAMLAAGYSDQSQCFIVQNSSGEKWGDKGYLFIPYEYMGTGDDCYDIHSIRLITDDSHHPRFPDTQNSHDEQRFWIPSDPHDYYHSIWPDKSTQNSSSKCESMMSYILWMDSDKEEIARMTKHLGSDPRVHVTFQPIFALALDYLLQNMDRIKSLPQSSIFQIICRGYYASEDKNAMDLLPFLSHYQLEHVPIIVITGDKPGVLNHFKGQASSMGIQNWKSRIFVTNNSSELITKINANLIEKCGNHRHD